tara:strand:+ start:41 stop:1030 length:990 start_codon:yes stop_codon:yes gene_type:complete
MWFDIIKETESERLRRLGYDVPKEMDMAPTINRQMIIDKIKEWVNNQEQISPFEAYFEIASSNQSALSAEHTKTVLVVEATTPTTRFFEESTTETVIQPGKETIDNNYRYTRHREGGNMNDTHVAKFFVGIYPVGGSALPINKNTTRSIDDMDFDVSNIIKVRDFPTIRAGGFFNNAVAMVDGTVDKQGRAWVVGNSGNKYIVDMKTGNCIVTLHNKPVEFIDQPEFNTTLDKVNLCIHNPEGNLPLGDNFAAVLLGLKNDTALSGDDLKIIQLIAKPWRFKIESYDKNSLKRLISRDSYSLQEGGAARILRDYWHDDEHGGYFDYWFP